MNERQAQNQIARAAHGVELHRTDGVYDPTVLLEALSHIPRQPPQPEGCSKK